MLEFLKIVTFFAILFGAIKLVRWVFGVDETHRLLSEISRKLGDDPAPPPPSVFSRLRDRVRLIPSTRVSGRASPAAVAALEKSGREKLASSEK